MAFDSATQGLSEAPQSVRRQHINARSKGRRGEQEVANLLRDVLTELGITEVQIKRNLMQWGGVKRSASQSDIVGLDFLAIEVKRVENNLPSGLAAWWAQAKAQASPQQTAVLFHRMNDRDWNVRFTLETQVGATRLRLPVDMEWKIFRIWLKLRLKQEYQLQ